MKGEIEDWYGKILLSVIIIVALCVIFIFILKPQIDFQLKVADLERERDVFLTKFCKNMGFETYKVKDVGKYNAYCYTERGMTRSVSYLTYDYDIIEGQYNFYILQEK